MRSHASSCSFLEQVSQRPGDRRAPATGHHRLYRLAAVHAGVLQDHVPEQVLGPGQQVGGDPEPCPVRLPPPGHCGTNAHPHRASRCRPATSLSITCSKRCRQPLRPGVSRRASPGSLNSVISAPQVLPWPSLVWPASPPSARCHSPMAAVPRSRMVASGSRARVSKRLADPIVAGGDHAARDRDGEFQVQALPA